MKIDFSHIKQKIILALLIMLVSIFTFSACNQVPEEYRIESFYGTYDKPATDTYDVFINHSDEILENNITEIWSIVSIDGSSFSYRSQFTNEIVEDTYDPLILAEIKSLMEKIGSSVTVEKKRIVLNDPNIVIPYKKTLYIEGADSLYLYDDKVDVGLGRYMDIDGEKNIRVFGTYLSSTAKNESGIEFTIRIIRYYKSEGLI